MYFVEDTLEPVLETVRSKYGAVAESSLSSEDAGVKAIAEAFGYTAEELASIPARANMGLSCGNPSATAHLQAGEVVVDLGCGGGLDVFLAARQVGPQGRAIGVDMTPAMIARARENARAGGYSNVEFYESTIDRVPLPDSTVDCIVSNCVLNLAPDKPAVFREMARILKPGGRVAIRDIALQQPLPEAIASSVAAYVGCIAGAIAIEEYRQGLRAAGFEHVEIVDTGADLSVYAKAEHSSGCCSPDVAVSADGESADGASSARETCSGPTANPDGSVHEDLATLLAGWDIGSAAASVQVYAVKP